jgi:hypothetical protein
MMHGEYCGGDGKVHSGYANIWFSEGTDKETVKTDQWLTLDSINRTYRTMNRYPDKQSMFCHYRTTAVVSWPILGGHSCRRTL